MVSTAIQHQWSPNVYFYYKPLSRLPASELLPSPIPSVTQADVTVAIKTPEGPIAFRLRLLSLLSLLSLVSSFQACSSLLF